MKIVGLTGGMGSGKTTVCNLFLEKDIPVYNSDLRAKWLMNNSSDLKLQIQLLLGSEAYNSNGELNRTFVSNKIFLDKSLLVEINKLVHPAVFHDFQSWIIQQNSTFVIKEAAILIESGGYKQCNIIISVVSDLETRIKRVIDRDNFTKEEILGRIKHQLSDEERMSKSDYLIHNNGNLSDLKEEVEKVYQQILVKLKK